jgi:hypothetical protein
VGAGTGLGCGARLPDCATVWVASNNSKPDVAKKTFLWRFR